MHRGYIKIWRKMLDNPWLQDPDFLALWVHMLLLATHKPIDQIWNGKRITLQPGQFISGRIKLAMLSGIHESKIYRILIVLKDEQQIEQLTSATSSLFTITNWAKYQDCEQQNEQRMNNERTASEQLVNTIQEHKKHKNIRTKEKKSFATTFPEDFSISEDILEWAKKKNYGNIQPFFEPFKLHHVSKSSMFTDWKAAFQKWVNNEFEWYPEKAKRLAGLNGKIVGDTNAAGLRNIARPGEFAEHLDF